ncbi:adenylate/guanylate cyclase domain-containing protein [Mesorhizobium sp. CAU 1732]|uniref:CHASE2 domain-containing protein n=1 Tax=Mesorhizobium sp. CAU 1732 TaxID=3140358 RepID=UPI003260ED48
MPVPVPWRRSFGNRRVVMAFLCCVAMLVLLPLTRTPPWRMVEAQAFDILSTLRMPALPDDAPIIVAIDESSLAEIGLQWPWPRELHARLIESLRAAGARAIGMDIIFADPTRPQADAALAAVMGPEIVLAADETFVETPQSSQLIRVEPLAALTDAGAVPGIASISLDGDGTLRRMPAYPDSFARRLRGIASGEAGEAASGLVQVYGPARTYQTVSYYQALDPPEFLPPDTFRDRIVIVGLSLQNAPTIAAGGADAYATSHTWSTGRLVAGAEIQATLYDNLRPGVLIQPAPEPIRLLGVVVAIALAAFAVWRGSGRKTLVIGLGALALLVTGSFLLLHGARFYMPPVAPALAFILVASAQSAWDYAAESRQRREIVRAFSQYLSPILVDRLASDPTQLKLGGERRTLSVLFADVRGFTTLAERMKDDPERLTNIVNRLLDPLSRIVLEEGGTIDKYIGDCIMAFWNAPLDEPDHAAKAVAAGLRMEGVLVALNEELAAEAQPGDDVIRLGIGVGINTGDCIVGNMGSRLRFDYSALGDAVNLAARLESKTRDYGVPVIVGPETAGLVAGRFALTELDRIAVKGRSEATPIYAVGALSPDGAAG